MTLNLWTSKGLLFRKVTLHMFKYQRVWRFCEGITRWQARPGLEGEDPSGSRGWWEPDHGWVVQWVHL